MDLTGGAVIGGQWTGDSIPRARASRRRYLAALATALALPVLAVCGSEARGAGDAVVRDSAGITIVENAPDAELRRWRVGSEPLVEIGGNTGDPSRQLYDVRGARRLPDGTIVVANGGTQELRFYASDGSLRHASGREGEGPGEFQGLVGLERLGTDSLVAYDAHAWRISVFDRNGRFGRSFHVEISGEGPLLPLLESVAGAEGRSLVFRDAAIFIPGSSGVVRDTVTYRLMDAEGGFRETLGRFPNVETWTRTSAGGAGIRTLPFGKRSRFAAADSGFYQGSAETYDIGYYALDGQPRRRIRLLRDPRPVTDGDVEAFQRTELAEADPERRPELERALPEISYPETMPAHETLVLDALDHLWVQEYRPDFEEGPNRWRIFDAEGHQVATAELPAGFTVYEIGEDFVLGGWQDALDLEYVRMYRLERNGEGS